MSIKKAVSAKKRDSVTEIGGVPLKLNKAEILDNLATMVRRA